MTKKKKARWEKKKTKESREVEKVLRTVFPQTDAYRYNSASIRVRVIDPRFEGKSNEERDALVEPLLEQLPEAIQAEIMNLVTLYSDEPEKSHQAFFANSEFEDPSPSLL
jgi:stress-induced morphogen